MKLYIRTSACLLLFIAFNFSTFAQRSVAYDSPQYEFNTAMELFQKEKFGSAQQYFKFVFEHTGEKQQDLKSNSYFYMGVCAAKLYNQDAAFLLQEFIRKYPVHAFVPEARFYLGKFYFYKKQYKKAIEQFNEIDEREIKKEEIAEYKFKKGYSYFITGNYDEAKVLMKAARECEGDYKLRAIYYLAHIAYQEKQYEAALEDFLLLQNVEEYKEEIPQYLMQIYFIQGEYEKMIAIAPSILNTGTPPPPEILRSLALAYYNLDLYPEAIATFEPILENSKIELDRKDLFAIGYSYYQIEKYKQAIDYLSRTTKQSEPDAITQNSYYLIADCYLKQHLLPFAAQSFLEASKYDFVPDIQEDALYNYAKLQYETSSSPFNSAIKALEQYINQYPNSTRSQEAHSYLSTIYLSTKNYQGAINSLEKIQTKSPALLRAYQRCTHFRALEMINNKNYKEALKLLNKSIRYPMDKDINTENLYWKAEAEYRLENYKDAFYSFQSYQKMPNAQEDPHYSISFYSYGYSALKLDKYNDAANAFATYLNLSKKSSDFDIEADATARLADCYFMQKNLKSAIAYYEKCERLNRSNVDYALYQQAKCYGFQKEDAQKIKLLEKLIQLYSKSFYSDDAEFELASTYHAQNEYALAITSYKNFIRKHPKSQYIRQAHNKLALSYLNTQETDLAIGTFKYVFETYPGSQEAKDALANLETIYTEQGNTSEFFDYIKNKNMNMSADRQDSIAYKAAENKYLRGDCETAIKSFEDYLKQFPNGLFAAKAYFYKAECEYGMNDFEKALNDYEQIINQYKTEYNEIALRKSATILYNNQAYAQALNYFNKLLEAASSDNNIIYGNNGVMRCAYELQKYREALTAANTLLNTNKTDPDLNNEAMLIAGKSAFELGDFVNAKKQLSVLAKSGSNDICAEAAYLIAVIDFKQGNYDACEKQISDILSGNYSSEYWYATTFILYGDVYAAKGNYFQARHTYQSIVDNYDGADLKEIARKKIAELDEKEGKK
ncbi:MAG: tetratricopeptide repeat protein [Bacteroidales bacterium]